MSQYPIMPRFRVYIDPFDYGAVEICFDPEEWLEPEQADELLRKQVLPRLQGFVSEANLPNTKSALCASVEACLRDLIAVGALKYGHDRKWVLQADEKPEFDGEIELNRQYWPKET